jgi:hypothetical protein
MQNQQADDEHVSFLRRSSVRILESLGLQGIAILISMTFGIISFLISIPILILNGFVLMKLWSWFIAPLGVVSLHHLFHQLSDFQSVQGVDTDRYQSVRPKLRARGHARYQQRHFQSVALEDVLPSGVISECLDRPPIYE